MLRKTAPFALALILAASGCLSFDGLCDTNADCGPGATCSADGVCEAQGGADGGPTDGGVDAGPDDGGAGPTDGGVDGGPDDGGSGTLVVSDVQVSPAVVGRVAGHDTVTIDFSVSAAAASVRVLVGAAEATCSDTDASRAFRCTYQVRADDLAGPHSITIDAASGEGVHGTADAGVDFDFEAPDAPAVSAAPEAHSPSAEASFVFSSSAGDLASYGCTLDDAPEAPCDGTYLTPTLGDGDHTFSVRAYDAAFNASDATTVTWSVDTVAPEQPVVSGLPALSNATDVALTFSAAGADLYECDLDGSGASPCASPFRKTGIAEGNHTFAVQAFDLAGNASAPAVFAFAIDRTGPPAPTLNGFPQSPTGSTDAVFSFSAGTAEQPARYECRLDAAGFSPCTSPQAYAGLADGSHTFEVRGYDALDNQGGTRTYGWTVDTSIPPTPSLTGPDPYTSAQTADLTFSSTAAVDHYVCRLDTQTIDPCTSPYHAAGLAEGGHTFEVSSVNAAGTSSQWAVLSWTIDTTPPPAPVVTGPASPTSNRSPVFTWPTSSDVTYTCSLDGAAAAACSGSYQPAQPLADGAHALVVAATDAAGNRTEARTAFDVDATPPPAPAITSSPSTPTRVATATFAFGCADASASFECRIDAASFAACASGYQTTVTAEGDHVFRVRAVDPAGNVGTATSFTWRFDQTPPAVTDRTPPAGTGAAPRDTTVSVAFDEALDLASVTSASFQLTRGTTPVATTSGHDPAGTVFTLQPTTLLDYATTYTVHVDGVADLAGNQLSGAGWTFTTRTDTDPPVFQTSSPVAGAASVRVDTLVDATFDETLDCASSSLVVQADGAPSPVPGQVSCSGTQITFAPSVQLVAFHGYTVSVTASDVHGNTSAVKTWTFTTGNGGDTTPPTVTLTVPAAGASGVRLDAPLRATFDEPIDAATLTAGFDLWSVAQSATVPGQVAYDAPSRTATFTPDAPLSPLEGYTGRLHNTVKDLAGNALAGSGVTFAFTTGNEPIPPTVASVTPADGAEGVLRPRVEVTFDEAMDASTIGPSTFYVFDGSQNVAGTVTYDPSTFTATFEGTTPFRAAYYQVTVRGSVRDLDGNPMGADYGWHFTSAWTTQTIPVSAGGPPSIALFQGHAYVGYGGVYGTDASGSWVETVLDGAGGRSSPRSIAVDAGGLVHLLYTRVASGIQSLVHVTDGDAPEVVASTAPAPYNSIQTFQLALDGSGTAHAVWMESIQDYTADAYAKYGSDAPVSWNVETVGSTSAGDGQYVALALADDGTPSVAYKIDGSPFVPLTLATQAASTWTSTPVTPDGDPVSVASFGSSVALLERSGGDLVYDVLSGSTWTPSTVNAAGQNLHAFDMALDADGRAHIVAAEGTTALLYVTDAFGGGWQQFTLEANPTTNVSASIAVDGAGRAHVVWWDAGAMRYAVP